MAAKTHVDSNVAERRLRPIYDCLDNGNNKRALQESEKVLKKQPQLQCARVLKSLALIRLGKEAEGEVILESVRKETPKEDHTLQAMTICYRELNKPDIICELYAAASKVDPSNEELLTHLFMSYVRVGDYKKQQQTAMALYKIKPKNPYYFWAIMSIVMQAYNAEPHLAKGVVLPLAERMVKRFVQEDRIEAEQEVQLYVMILEMQDKLQEALEVIEGPLGEKLQSYITVPTKRVELLMKMERWKEANISVKKLLLDDVDNWSLYLKYLESVFHLKSNLSLEESDEKLNSSFEDCVQFLCELREKNISLKHNFRGPYLAQIELYAKLHRHGEDAEKYVGSLCDLLINYFQQFGSRQCCVNDLRPYLNVLNQADISTFLDRIWKLVELEDGQLPTSKEQMLRYISNLQITRYLGFHEKLSCEAKLQLTSCLMRYYHHANQFNNPNVLCTDILHNDPFVMLVAHMLSDIWLETKETSYLKEAILVLEFALEKSPSNFQMKLLLIRLYNTLGISKAAYRIYELLDLKHMQLDSLGYLQCWSLLSTSQYLLATHIFDTTLKFFTTNYKDGADHLTFSYKFGSFLKISEFVDFRDRLSKSLHYRLVTIEKMLLDIFQTTSFCQTTQVLEQMMILSEEDKTDFNQLSDNRDLDVFWTADPLHKRITAEMIKQSFKQDYYLMRVRSLILRVIAASVEMAALDQNCCNGDNNESNKPNTKDTLTSLVSQLKSLVYELSENPPTKVFQNIITAPLDSRLLAVLESPLVSIVIDLSEAVVDMAIMANSDCDKTDASMPSPTVTLDNFERNICKIFKNLDSTVTNDISNISARQKVLSDLSLHTEIICISAIGCGIFHKLLRNGVTQHKKLKKKKDVEMSGKPKILGDVESHQVQVVKRCISTINKQSNDMMRLVSSVLKVWQEIDTENNICFLLKELEKISEDTHVFVLNNKLKELHSNVELRISESYSSSLTEIQSNLKLKCKYLSELIF